MTLERESTVPDRHENGGSPIRLFLAGDVMTGRGIDQILGHPGDPALYEPSVRDARVYVELAEQANGPVPRRAGPGYVWGDALPILDEAAPDARIVNLETAVTDRGRPWPDKGIHYRMHPANIGCLTAARIDCCTLANNHVLDWSQPGLEQTLDTVSGSGVATVGAGRTFEEAWSPAVIGTDSGRRAVVLGVATTSSGVPPPWAAGPGPGVALVDPSSDHDVDRVAAAVEACAEPEDVVVLSIHWGSNWGYSIPSAHRRFAQRLIDEAGVDIVHGHSSHHPIGIEVHQGRLVLYGCGDLITDYEGIGGHRQYRGELGALYLASVGEGGLLQRLDLVLTRMRRLRLERAAGDDAAWLAKTLRRESAPLGVDLVPDDDGRLTAGW